MAQFRIHKRPLVGSVLNQMYPFHTLRPYFSEIYRIAFLLLRSVPCGLFLLDFQLKFWFRFLFTVRAACIHEESKMMMLVIMLLTCSHVLIRTLFIFIY